MIVTRIVLVALLTFNIAVAMQPPQQPAKSANSATAAKKSVPANDIFSGSVTAVTAETVTVVRKVPAKADESRDFVLDKDTKVEGKLKVNARVTVRFKADAAGLVHALRIIVRADGKTTTGAGRAEHPGTTK
jgi:hypothetical protein